MSIQNNPIFRNSTTIDRMQSVYSIFLIATHQSKIATLIKSIVQTFRLTVSSSNTHRIVRSSKLYYLLTRRIGSETVGVDLRETKFIGSILNSIQRCVTKILAGGSTIPGTTTTYRTLYKLLSIFSARPVRTLSVLLISSVLIISIWLVSIQMASNAVATILLAVLLLSIRGLDKTVSFKVISQHTSLRPIVERSSQLKNTSIIFGQLTQYQLLAGLVGCFLFTSLLRVLSLGGDVIIDFLSFVIFSIIIITVTWKFTDPITQT